MRNFLGSVFFALLAACGGDGGTGPSTSYENVAGNYAGTLAGASQGIALDSEISLSLSQSSGSVTGTYAITGFVTDGVNVDQINGTGTIQGTIASGANPSVNLTIRSAGCPNQPMQFSGTYDSPNNRLTIIGPVKFYELDCSVWWQAQATIVLTP